MNRVLGVMFVLGACGGSRETPVDTQGAAGDAATADVGVKTGARMYQQLITYTDAMHAMQYANGFVYAVDSAANTVEVFDGTTRGHVTTIPVGNIPGDLATDGQYVYVANMTARDEGDPYLSVIDPSMQKVVDAATVHELVWGDDPDNDPWTNFPTNVAVLGSQAYVVFPANAVPGLIPVDRGSLHEHTYAAAGSAPANLAGVGDLLVITNLLALGNFTDDEVRIQTTDGTLMTTLSTGGKLHDARTVGDRVWVAHAPTGGVPGELLVIDPTTATMESIPTAAGVYGVAVSGNLVYATCTDANRIQVFDATSHMLVEDIDLGVFAPGVMNTRGIAATPAGDIFFESDGMLSALYR